MRKIFLQAAATHERPLRAYPLPSAIPDDVHDRSRSWKSEPIRSWFDKQSGYIGGISSRMALQTRRTVALRFSTMRSPSELSAMASKNSRRCARWLLSMSIIADVLFINSQWWWLKFKNLRFHGSLDRNSIQLPFRMTVAACRSGYKPWRNKCLKCTPKKPISWAIQ